MCALVTGVQTCALPIFDHGGHVHPRDDRAAPAPFLVDQRMEGTGRCQRHAAGHRSEEHTSELQSLMRKSYAVFCLKKKRCQQGSITKSHGSESRNRTKL